jgi:hypothetical protein
MKCNQLEAGCVQERREFLAAALLGVKRDLHMEIK